MTQPNLDEAVERALILAMCRPHHPRQHEGGGVMGDAEFYTTDDRIERYEVEPLYSPSTVSALQSALQAQVLADAAHHNYIERERAQADAQVEALQAENERLQAEVTRLLTAFDGLDLGVGVDDG